MPKTIKLFITMLCLLPASIVVAQTNEQTAHQKGLQAVKLEDEGKFDEAIKLLEEAQKLDPASLTYPYELAYSYYSKQDYKKAISYLEPIAVNPNAYDRVFQLLGNSYDDLGESEKALKVYSEGLQKFPKSGLLFLEEGNVYWAKKQYDKAITFYEQGIQADPAFPSNYYRATLLYCNSTEEVWGMVYGEIFMNLERNTNRTAEVSKLLYNTYKSQIKINSSTSMSVSFSKNNTISSDQLTGGDGIKLPFGNIYEMTTTFAAAGEQAINLTSLNTIRTRFLDMYYQKGFNKQYPNALFNYQKKVKEAGHIEAYNHWLLMKGDEPEFTKWQQANQAEWDNFVKWFSDNGMELNESNHFSRRQYQ